MRRAVIALLAPLLVLAATGPLLADGASDLVAALGQARGSRTPIHAILGALADLPDVTLDGPALREALRRSGLPAHAASDRILGAVTSLERRRDRLVLRLAAATSTEVVIKGDSKGWVHLAPVVSLRLRRVGERDVLIDDLTGIRLSKHQGSFAVSLKRIAAAWAPGPASTRPVARITAGLTWPLERTVTVDLTDPTKLPPTDEATLGLAGSIAR